jgi:hypothetical protein
MEEIFITTAFQLCFGICHQEDPREPEVTDTGMGHISFWPMPMMLI